ncbi:MAG: PHB depolymerase family esterase [Betaproteobacteria bacterium]|nr:PHB depolymerase family esterase [Betaproteobacteria bacterium]
MKSISRLVDALTTPGFGRQTWPPKPVRPAKPTPRREAGRRIHSTPTEGTFAREQFIYEPESPAVVARRPEYWLYTPPLRGSKPPALMVMLHGCKQSAEALAHGTRMNALADREGFIVLYPEQPRRAHPQCCWHWYDPEHVGAREADGISRLVEQTLEQTGADPSRVYLAGLSAGAGLAGLMAHPKLFAALALHSGPALGIARTPASALNLMRRGARVDPIEALSTMVDVAAYPGMPTMLLHGLRDDAVNPANQAQLASQFRALNHLTDATCVSRETSRGDGFVLRNDMRDGECVVSLCQLTATGHAWSGGDPRYAFHAPGPDATWLWWQFARRHVRETALAA